jgi:pilus assembly protein CpaE
VSQQADGTIFWVTPDGNGSRDAIQQIAGEFNLAVRWCGFGELFNQLQMGRCRLVTVEFGNKPDEALLLLKQLRERAPHVVAVAASADSSVQTLRAALRAGASDFLSLPLDEKELNKVLIKLTQGSSARIAGDVLGQVITFCGARGGLGVTTLAVNVAARLAVRAESGVVLVDLDLQRGDVAAFLNLSPTQSLAAVATARGEVDALFLQDLLTRHPSGVFVLPAPPQMEEADAVGHPEVDLALRLLRSQFGYVLIDTARSITGATLAALEHSDRILLLTDLSVPGVRAARRMVELLGRLNVPTERVELLVAQSVRGPVLMADAIRAIGKEPLMTIARDQATASDLMNAGTPLNGVRQTALAGSIDELTAKLMGDRSAVEAEPGLLQRFFGRRS